MNRAGYLNNDFHAMLLLARAAAEAPDLELGMVSLLPLYRPVEAAEQVATLDVICGGRFVLAPALGWRDFQFNAFGVPKKERLSRFREVMVVMKKLWSQERVAHHGKHFHMDDVPVPVVCCKDPSLRCTSQPTWMLGLLERPGKVTVGW